MGKSNQLKAVEISIKYRGEVLHACIVLEKDIDEYIGSYFIKELAQQVEFLEIILDRLTFDAKISILEVLLKKQYSEDTFKKKYVKLFTELRYVKDHRNIFAHYLVNAFATTIYGKKEIGFLNFRNATTIETYDKGKYTLLTNRIMKCIEVIRKIIDEQ